MDMSMLAGVIIGGLLSILGGYLANKQQNKYREKVSRERARETKRERMKKACLAMSAVAYDLNKVEDELGEVSGSGRYPDTYAKLLQARALIALECAENATIDAASEQVLSQYAGLLYEAWGCADEITFLNATAASGEFDRFRELINEFVSVTVRELNAPGSPGEG